MEGNLLQRQMLLEKAGPDRETQRMLWDACSRDILYFVNLSWEAMDSSGSKEPIYLESSEVYYLVVDNSRDNENGDSLRFRIQFFGWK